MNRLFVILIALTFAPTVRAMPSPQELLVAESREIAACNSPITELAPLELKIVHGKDPKNEYFENKASTLAALKILAKYPGRPKASAALLDMLEDTSRGPVADRISIVLQSKPCNELGYFKSFRHLIASARRYKFTLEERAGVRLATLNFVEKDLMGPMTSIAFTLRVSLVRQLIDDGMLKLAPGHWTRFQLVEERAKMLRERLVDAAIDWPENVTADNVKTFSEKTQRSIYRMLIVEKKEVAGMQPRLVEALEEHLL